MPLLIALPQAQIFISCGPLHRVQSNSANPPPTIRTAIVHPSGCDVAARAIPSVEAVLYAAGVVHSISVIVPLPVITFHWCAPSLSFVCSFHHLAFLFGCFWESIKGGRGRQRDRGEKEGRGGERKREGKICRDSQLATREQEQQQHQDRWVVGGNYIQEGSHRPSGTYPPTSSSPNMAGRGSTVCASRHSFHVQLSTYSLRSEANQDQVCVADQLMSELATRTLQVCVEESEKRELGGEWSSLFLLGEVAQLAAMVVVVGAGDCGWCQQGNAYNGVRQW